MTMPMVSSLASVRALLLGKPSAGRVCSRSGQLMTLACDGVFETNTELDEFRQFTYAMPRWRTPAGNGSSRWPPRWKPDPAPAPGGSNFPRGRPASSCGAHTHDPANRALAQQTMRQACANNVPPAGGGGPPQGDTMVMIAVSVSKVTHCVTFDTETAILSP